MNKTAITLRGLPELRAALRQLPAELQTEASAIIQRYAQRTYTDFRTAVSVHTGNLQRGIKIDDPRAYGGIVSQKVRSTAPHAWMWENGTKKRETLGDKSVRAGANRGRMKKAPPGYGLRSIAPRNRDQMNSELWMLVQNAGFRLEGSF